MTQQDSQSEPAGPTSPVGPGHDWSAVEQAAAAMRRLNRALAGRRVDDAVLGEVTAAVTAAADRLEQGTLRVKLDDMLSRPYLREIYEGQFFPLPLEVGDEIEFDPFSIGGGLFHPASVDVRYFKESDEAVTGEAVVDPMFAGPPERTHGGVVALIIDELMGALNRMRGRQAYTGRLTVHYRAATPLGEPLRLRAWIRDTSGRKIIQHAEVHGPEGLCVTAEGLFILRADAPPEPEA
ncbi:PaaI family thioesterase [Candidatus Poriferisodalis sp.]|uniref:PaaI family thioesterase n=1 Tax=Candidatus Poriferisodalis sp. TaxID=3101277 RepID=UPI003B02D2D0